MHLMGYRTRWVILALVTLAHMNRCAAQLFGPPDTLLYASELPVFWDMDHDGDVDALVIKDGGWPTFSDSLFLMANDGNGSFSVLTFLDTATAEPLNFGDPLFRVVDADTDDDPELLFTRFTGEGPSLFIADAGDSGYEQRVLFTSSPGTGTLGQYHPLDAEGDGDMDLLVGLSWDGILLLRNDGSGSFTQEPVNANGVFRLFPPFDWDGDGDLDLMGGDGIETYLTVSLAVNGEWGFPWNNVENSGTYGSRCVITDLNGDGYVDYIIGRLVSLRTPGGAMQILYSATQNFVVGNVDCDEELELVGGGTVQDLVPEGITSRAISSLSAFFGYSLMQDVNADGKADLVEKDGGFGPIRLRMNIAEPPTVTLDLPALPVSMDTVLMLTGGLPEGGYYSGVGVYDGFLYADLVGSGPVEITYHYSEPESSCASSATAQLIVAEQNSVNELEGSFWSAYPNPCRDYLDISTTLAGTFAVHFFDATGRAQGSYTLRARTPDTGPTRIPLDHLGPGLFAVLLEGSDGRRYRISILHDATH